jgi:hypothetical protein
LGDFEMIVEDNKLNALLEYAKSEGRVCPMPIFWNELWTMLPGKTQKPSGGWEPPLPLILAAWWDVPALSKMLRLAEHLNYAAEHGVLDKVDIYLRSLKPNQWAYGDGTTEYRKPDAVL